MSACAPLIGIARVAFAEGMLEDVRIARKRGRPKDDVVSKSDTPGSSRWRAPIHRLILEVLVWRLTLGDLRPNDRPLRACRMEP